MAGVYSPAFLYANPIQSTGYSSNGTDITPSC